jgi:hypothetical protein
MITKQTREQIEKITSNWFKFFAQKEGLVDCPENGAKLATFIEHHFQGEYTYDNLTSAMESQRSQLIGIGVALTPAMQQEIANREKAIKDAELAKQQATHNNTTVANFVKNHAPLGLVAVNGDFPESTQDRLVDFIKNKYPGQLLTNAILKDAIEATWDSLLWFSREPADRVFRNIAKAPRILSEKAKQEAGLIPQRDLRSHSTDGKFTNPNDALRGMLKKVAGEGEGPDQIAAEKISVNTRFGKLDHGATAAIRKEFVYDRKGAIDWKLTKDKRMRLAGEYELRRNRVGRFER